MMDNIFAMELWHIEIFGNTTLDFITAFFAFFAMLVVFGVLQNMVLFKLKRFALHTRTEIDDALLEILKTIKPPFYYFVAFYIAVKMLAVHPVLQKIIDVTLIIWVVYQSVAVAQILINHIVKKTVGREDDGGTKSAIKAIGIISKGVLWALGGLFILSNLGVNVTSLIAGLGIGGIAIGLALQNILSDLFSSFAIFFDKPFLVGDFVVVGEHMGVIEKIGIKTTRLRALQGEEIVISNKELTSARVQNFKRMHQRRVVFRFGVTYDTPGEKLKKIPAMVREIIESAPMTRFDRAHFIAFGDFALMFEAVYYVTSGDYNQYMDTHQNIHFGIRDMFEKEGIAMAYPTQTVYVKK